MKTKHLSTASSALASVMFCACNKVDVSAIAVADSAVELQIPSRERGVNVTPSEAATLAEQFANSADGIAGMASKAGMKHSSKISSSATLREDGQELMYVFNYEDGGWVIVGSTREYYPILAYSDKGKFELQEDMGPVDVWLDETKVSIKHASELSVEEKAQMRSLWSHYEDAGLLAEKTKAARVLTKSAGEDACWARIDSLQSVYGSEGWTFTTVSAAEQLFTDLGLTSYYSDICYSATQNHSALNETLIGYKNPVRNEVGPLIGTLWHQVTPFNDYCPGECQAGCGPVAVAQLMRHYAKPDTMSWNIFTFTWDNLPVAYSVTDTTQRHAQLIRYLWQKLQVTVSPPLRVKTTATKIKNGLESMDYTATIHNPHTNASVRDQLLNYSRPVIMFGMDSSDVDGHFWVCEGAKEIYLNQIVFYTENQPYGTGTFTPGMYSRTNPGIVGGSNPSLDFYMNWGWGQKSTYSGPLNGWYSSNNVNVDGSNYIVEPFAWTGLSPC